MGCTSGKASRKGIKITPEMVEKMKVDPGRQVSLYPYQEFRLTPIDYEKIIAQNEPWIDTYFRPEKSSILDASIPIPGRLKEWETFEWRRPKDVYGKGNFSLFNNIGPSDIKQGSCGDCYFLSSIASLAENPERVKEIFINKDINKAGCYAMHMYVNGEPQTIVVDDYFPFNPRKNDWAFSKSSCEKEIWVLLLEKAWAKIHGSYQRIEAGTTGEALPVLTGAPSDFFYHGEVKNKDDIWKRIRDADLKNQIIATAVHSQRQGKTSVEMQRVGLVDAHAYSLMSTFEVDDSQGNKLRLIQIRNPWGFKEWNGDWSDKSQKWTQDLKDELGFEDKDDGVFFISFEDYINFFYITTICKYVNENDVTVMPDEHAQHEYCVQKITVEKDQEGLVSIIVNQLHARIADLKMQGQYRYAPIKLMLMKKINAVPSLNGTATGQGDTQSLDRYDSLIFIEGQYICYQHAHIQLPRMSQGEYFLFFKADWLNTIHKERRLVMSIYAPDPFKIEKINAKSFTYELYGEVEDMLSDRIRKGLAYQLPNY